MNRTATSQATARSVRQNVRIIECSSKNAGRTTHECLNCLASSVDLSFFSKSQQLWLTTRDCRWRSAKTRTAHFGQLSFLFQPSSKLDFPFRFPLLCFEKRGERHVYGERAVDGTVGSLLHSCCPHSGLLDFWILWQHVTGA